MTEEKEKIINAFNNAWNKKIASENSYGKLASKEMFENKEEIIIDGVDVAGCKFYDKRAVLYDCTEDTTSGDNDCYRCKDEPNCYYKQLQHLKQENKELKKQIESQKGLITVGGKQQYEMTMAYDRCKSALEEIREIIDGHASPPECDYYGSYKNACEPCALRILKQTEGKIIDKINEALK